MPSTIEKQVYRSGPYQHFYSQAVRVGDHLYLAGQISTDDDYTVLDPGDVTAQFRNAYENVQTVLAKFGATLDNVVEETIFVTDMDAVMGNIEAITAVREEVFGGPPAVAQTLVQVAGLVFPELMVEIRCVARLTPTP